jgi:hypothetical protein
MLTLDRNQGVLRVAHDTPALRREGVHWWLRYPHEHAPGRLARQDAGGEERGCACGGRAEVDGCAKHIMTVL